MCSAIRPLFLVPKLFECESSLANLAVVTMGQALDLLVEGYPQVVQESLLRMVQSVADATMSSKRSISSLRLLIQLVVQSPHILQIIAEEALSVCE